MRTGGKAATAIVGASICLSPCLVSSGAVHTYPSCSAHTLPLPAQAMQRATIRALVRNAQSTVLRHLFGCQQRVAVFTSPCGSAEAVTMFAHSGPSSQHRDNLTARAPEAWFTNAPPHSMFPSHYTHLGTQHYHLRIAIITNEVCSQKHLPTCHLPRARRSASDGADFRSKSYCHTVKAAKTWFAHAHTIDAESRSLQGGSPGHGSVFSQNSPENPGSQKHRPLKQTP